MYAPIITTIKRDKSSGRATHTIANFADQPAKMARHYEWEGMGAEHAHLKRAGTRCCAPIPMGSMCLRALTRTGWYGFVSVASWGPMGAATGA